MKRKKGKTRMIPSLVLGRKLQRQCLCRAQIPDALYDGCIKGPGREEWDSLRKNALCPPISIKDNDKDESKGGEGGNGSKEPFRGRE